AEWARAGAAIIDADVLAREAVAPGTPGLAAVVAAFGPEVLHADGSLDRAALRGLVFEDAAARARLESIVHPEIARLRAEREAELAAAGATLVVHVIPLLFEVGLERDFDVVVLVDAPEAVRRARLVERRGLDGEGARRMIAAQLPAAAKRAHATIVIDNDGTLDALRERARAVWTGLRERAAECA
ncbi:MAG TPA: dephospho-CoA kinase, partial [Gemmatimonadales bacterium]|nr:dephospho-CoA kinase [Gemmatimonadales bacterium]